MLKGWSPKSPCIYSGTAGIRIGGSVAAISRLVTGTPRGGRTHVNSRNSRLECGAYMIARNVDALNPQASTREHGCSRFGA